MFFDQLLTDAKKPGEHYHTTAYQSTHTCGGAIMGAAAGWRLSDAEAAEPVTFVRTSWSNYAPAV